MDSNGDIPIERATSNHTTARFYAANFASFAQTRAFAEAILRDYDRLDVLVNNAEFGSAPDERLLSEDGHEFRFQVNYLAGFLLTKMLMLLLLDSTPSRIVNVSSLAANPIDFDDVMIEKNFSGGWAVLHRPASRTRQRSGVRPGGTGRAEELE